MTRVLGVVLSSVLLLSVCSTASGQSENSVRGAIESLQTQVDALRKQLAAIRTFEIIFRDLTTGVVLAPGETAVRVLACPLGEVVVTGGYNSFPADVLQIVLNAPFIDAGSHAPLALSGWRVDFYNPGTVTVAVNVRLSVSCTPGNGRVE
jgi:hypothetical protein